MSYSLRSTTSTAFQLTALSLALVLAGCGGGGTDTVAPEPDLGVQPDGSTDAPIRNANISPISMTDSAGQLTRIVTSSGATASVKVTDAKGEPISGALVKFGTDASVSSVRFGNTNGTVLTNADGLASMTLKAVDPSDTGSYALSATVTSNDVSANSPAYFFSLQSANLIFDAVRLEKNSLPYGGSTDITGLVKNSATMEAQKDVEISFAASCGTVSSATTNVLGFRATYDAGTCEGTQTIVASIGESGATIRLPVAINQRTELGALGIRCISGDTPNFPDSSTGTGADACAQPVSLGVIGSTLPSVRTVEFLVNKDGSKPFANERVKVELLSAPNDFGMGTRGNQQPLTLTTDNAGRVKVPLYAGTTIGDIRLRATLISRADVTATFENIEVVDRVPTQERFAVTPSKNVLAATEVTSVGGVPTTRRLNDSTTLNVIARDGDNNFVNGSTINFIAEGGTLSSNTCVVNNGRCSVTLSTTGVLPNDRRVTVLAYTSGEIEEDDADKRQALNNINSNGIFLDENENGVANVNEFKLPSTTDIIFTQFVVGFADTTPIFTPSSLGSIAANPNGTSQKAFTMYGFNPQGNKKISMPSNTSIRVQAVDKTSGSVSCKAQISSNGIVSNTLPVPMMVNLSTPDNRNVLGANQNDTDKSYVLRTQNCSAGDEIKLTVTTPAPNSKTTTEIIAVL